MERTNAVRIYFREVLGEMRKTSWPSWETLVRLTGIVIGMVTVVSIYLFALDLPLSWGLSKFFGR